MWESNLKIYDEIVKRSSEYKRKGKTMPYTSSNGHMFSLLNKDGEFGIRLSKEDQEKFKELYNATIFKSYGAVMRDYVKVPQGIFEDIDLVSSWLDKGFEYVNSLKPK